MEKLLFRFAATLILTAIPACTIATRTGDQKTQNNNAAPVSKSDEERPDRADHSTATAPETAHSIDVAGLYSVNGSSLDGKGYDGEMLVTKRDSVFQFSWKIGTSSYDGVGVQSGNNIAVAYNSGADGKGCGAVIYKINTAGDSLDGLWGEWGVNQAGTEKAVANAKTTETSGSFDVTGTNSDGSSYKGKLSVTRGSEDVYQFAWNVGRKYIGTGIRMGDYLAAGFGSKHCGFVIYEVKGDKLEGKWGVPGTTRLGTETAAKK